jgi:CheY-like chemotaxis protein
MDKFHMTIKPTDSRRVLVADDDPVMRHLITTIIKQQGYEVVIANDGREAYRILQSDSQFTAAILDMTMPYLQGLDLIRYMRSEKRLMRIPIMMITAEQDIKLMASSFSAGATAFLPKPFTPEQLQSAIRMLLGNRRSTRIAA